jgi:hypothetical protein
MDGATHPAFGVDATGRGPRRVATSDGCAWGPHTQGFWVHHQLRARTLKQKPPKPPKTRSDPHFNVPRVSTRAFLALSSHAGTAPALLFIKTKKYHVRPPSSTAAQSPRVELAVGPQVGAQAPVPLGNPFSLANKVGNSSSLARQPGRTPPSSCRLRWATN